MRYVFVKIFGLKTILLLKWFGAENIPLVRGRLVFYLYNISEASLLYCLAGLWQIYFCWKKKNSMEICLKSMTFVHETQIAPLIKTEILLIVELIIKDSNLQQVCFL